MKAMILAIRLKYFYLTYKGIKTEEIRKTCPKNFVGDVYEYVSKTNFEKELLEIPENEREFFKQFKGKIGLKFTVRKVERFDVPYPAYFSQVEKDYKHITDNSCLTLMELHHYLKNETGYAYHIEDLVIFDRPKELSEFKFIKKYHSCNGCPHNFIYFGNNDEIGIVCRTCQELKPLTKAPQNFVFVESEE